LQEKHFATSTSLIPLAFFFIFPPAERVQGQSCTRVSPEHPLHAQPPGLHRSPRAFCQPRVSSPALVPWSPLRGIALAPAQGNPQLHSGEQSGCSPGSPRPPRDGRAAAEQGWGSESSSQPCCCRLLPGQAKGWEEAASPQDRGCLVGYDRVGSRGTATLCLHIGFGGFKTRNRARVRPGSESAGFKLLGSQTAPTVMGTWWDCQASSELTD